MPFHLRIALPIFAATLFLSATLLFVVELMVGKMILPLLGGTPAVWNTCMFFYQASLLAGYLYAHLASTHLDRRKQIICQLVLLALPFVFLLLPIRVKEELAPLGDSNQVLGVLLLLAVSAGLPFFVISTTAPLLQKWFASTSHPSAKDPYFLYAASNVGSMLGLLIYPLQKVGIEANLPLRFEKAGLVSQSGLWTVGFGLLVALSALCGLVLWRSPQPAFEADAEKKGSKRFKKEPGRKSWNRGGTDRAGAWERRGELADTVTGGQRLRWIALAFVPSSLLLGATTYITTDVAAIPLLWVLPLVLYLLSFILVFSRLPEAVHKTMVVALPLVVLLQVFIMMSNLGRLPMWGKIGIHLVVLFAAAMVCHGELARSRPSTRHLTEFYLLMSVGGVLGGLFNALIAPMIFNSIIEYPLVMVLALLFLPRGPDEDTSSEALFKDFGYPAALGVLSLILVSELFSISLDLRQVGMFFTEIPDWLVSFLTRHAKQIQGSFAKIVQFGIPVVICYTFVDRPLRLALGLGAILLAHGFVQHSRESVLFQERSFFGVLKVEKDDEFHRLLHGTTLHGTQRYHWDARTTLFAARHQWAGVGLASTSPLAAALYWAGVDALYWKGEQPEWLDPRREALTYYHRTGPIGQVMQAFRGEQRKPHIAVIGLGTGTMASYGEPGQKITFYDIDKHVRDIAYNPDYFTYLKDAEDRGAVPDVILGDARVELRKAVKEKPDEKYGLMVIDAFSSDAIPVHLIVREALEEAYLPKLDKGGILAFHISNRHLDLEPVLGNLAEALKLKGLVQHDVQEGPPGKAASTWVLLAREEEDFGDLDHEYRWGKRKPVHEAVEAILSGCPGSSLLSGCPGSSLGGLAAYLTAVEREPRWHILKGKPKVGVWTDDFNNLLSVFSWK